MCDRQNDIAVFSISLVSCQCFCSHRFVPFKWPGENITEHINICTSTYKPTYGTGKRHQVVPTGCPSSGLNTPLYHGQASIYPYTHIHTVTLAAVALATF